MAFSFDQRHLKHISFLEPPGCMREILLHPFKRDHCIELALFQEHRFAFYYWLKWTNNSLTEIPSLISYDWHQDLAPPYKDELEELQELDTTNRAEVALYTWAKLSHFNDVQIRAALLLNKLKDVYVICRQDVGRKAKEEIRDIYGNVHTINIFRSTEAFDAYVPCIEDQKVYLDIDLDFFTFGNPTSGKSPFNTKGYTYMKQAAIKELFSANSETLRWILRRLAGFTIATEPEFCGGLKKSNYFLGILDNIFFTPSLFHRDLRGDGTKWRQEIIDAL